MQYFQNISNQALVQLKASIKSDFLNRAGSVITGIQQSTSIDKKEKAKQINAALNAVLTLVKDTFTQQKNLDTEDKAIMALIVQYVFTCLSLENRNTVWNYNSIDFSRRVGELWERFCSVAWDYSTSAIRFNAPNFSVVTTSIINRAQTLTTSSPQQQDILDLVNDLLEIIGDINLKEDEMFHLNGTRYVVDFKSGFGSNEKGNMLRLQAVSRAYKRFDPNTNLLLLVRQNTNNNYLNVLRQSQTWDIYTGTQSYQKIQALTNVNILWVIQNVVDFRNDLPQSFLTYLQTTSGNPINYLDW
ncbi:hypothetical protein [Acinetobacter sp. YH16058]|uniref:hypothetical protein n=2 Tax=unclassified Acinetobacter TaxID=196816 RepID=UPI0015D1C4D5|nr:hypothetical protein [Acinetobacter sp. YH16058]